MIFLFPKNARNNKIDYLKNLSRLIKVMYLITRVVQKKDRVMNNSQAVNKKTALKIARSIEPENSNLQITRGCTNRHAIEAALLKKYFMETTKGYLRR